MRQSPAVNSAKLATLSPDTEIRVVDNTRQNGYVRVLFGTGEQGYVYYKNIEVSGEALSEDFFKLKETDSLLAARAADVPCINTGFASCPARGCYAPSTPGALFNEAKRRSPIGRNPISISFADLEQMQNEVGNRLGLRSQNKALSAAERETLKNIRVTNGIVGESTLVKLIGFIPAVGEGLKEGSVETVNCKFSEDNQKDIHIPLVAQFNITEFGGIVIEMIPQNRPASWTLQKLKKVRHDKRKVMVIGGLFYDNEHLVNRNPARPLRGHSKRFSIWEIHPVTQFFVCNRIDNSCSLTNMNGWVPLENFQ
ncbi:MAG TPA: hypothetical protein VF644_10180 [Pyrinomonadaceae bacterium]